MLLSRSQGLFFKLILPISLVIVCAVNFTFSDSDSKQNTLNLLEFEEDTRGQFSYYLDLIQDTTVKPDIVNYSKCFDNYSVLNEYDLKIADHRLSVVDFNFRDAAVELQFGSDSELEIGTLFEAILNQYNEEEYVDLLGGVKSDLQYKNVLWSHYYEDKKLYDKAIVFAKKEFDLYGEEDVYDRILNLIEKHQTEQNYIDFIESAQGRGFNGRTERKYFFKQKNVFQYLYQLTSPIYSYKNLVLIVISFLASIVWMSYLVGLKFFKKSNYLFLGVVFVVSVLVSESTLFFYDLFHIWFVDYGVISDESLAYYVFVVGLIEEVVKVFTPLLVLFFFRSKMVEPIDFIIVPSVSALAFAFGENVLYSSYDFSTIDTRTLSCCFLHLFLSSFVFYSFVKNGVNNLKSCIPRFILYFLGAIVIHGVYDYMLGVAFPGWVISLVILLIGMSVWVQFVSNAVNQSPFFKRDLIPTGSSLINRILVGFCFVILLEYLYAVVTLGLGVANANWTASWYTTVLMLTVLVFKLGKVEFVKGEVNPIQFWNLSGLLNFEKYENLLVEIQFVKGQLGNDVLEGKVIGNLNFSSKESYLIVQLTEPVSSAEGVFEKVLVKLAKKGSDIYDPNVVVVVRAVVQEDALKADKVAMKSFPLLSTAVLNEIAEYAQVRLES